MEISVPKVILSLRSKGFDLGFDLGFDDVVENCFIWDIQVSSKYGAVGSDSFDDVLLLVWIIVSLCARYELSM